MKWIVAGLSAIGSIGQCADEVAALRGRRSMRLYGGRAPFYNGTFRCVAAKARWLLLESPSRFILLLEHDVFRKPVPTFRHHALGFREMSRMNAKSLASLALTVVGSLLCMVLVMRPTVVSGASMMPTLHDKDVLIASPLAQRLFQPARGDIVTVCLSGSPLCGLVFSGDTQYVKRIVAVPGDVVRYGNSASS